ncbi:MAG: hydrogenase formation protein HypD [Geminicoccaceae bacterium]
MKFREEFRDPAAARHCLDAIAAIATRPWTLMEICGGQTHAIVRYGIDRLLPAGITLLHGPGCPVCVTPLESIDRAIGIAGRPGVIFCSFGDMLRVPGSDGDLLAAKSRGADVRIVYSPLDALQIARENPGREVVFFAVGFETTAPANAMAVYQAARAGITNFSVLVAQVLVPPAMVALLADDACRIQGFLAAGHVCTVMGTAEYEPLAQRFKVPIVVTGFEPVDILAGILCCIRQLESGRFEVENAYDRSVRSAGNEPAQRLIREVFRVIPRQWRGIGEIPASGLGLAEDYAGFDAETRFDLADVISTQSGECISGPILRGERKPPECPAFGKRCTPEHPLGVTMVSSEGACAAYYRYRGLELPAAAG